MAVGFFWLFVAVHAQLLFARDLVRRHECACGSRGTVLRNQSHFGRRPIFSAESVLMLPLASFSWSLQPAERILANLCDDMHEWVHQLSNVVLHRRAEDDGGFVGLQLIVAL